MAGRRQSSDRHGRSDRAGGCLHHVVADAGDQTVGRDRQVIGRAVVQDDAELVAGHASQMVLPAHLRMQALADRGNDLVGDVEAVGFVDAAKLIDRGQQEAAGRAKLHRLLDRGRENLGQAIAVQLAGECIAARGNRSGGIRDGRRSGELGRMTVVHIVGSVGAIPADHHGPSR
jgi:hypothetical protein